ncbi:MAG: endonuclease III [Acidobacteriota bacterium]
MSCQTKLNEIEKIIKTLKKESSRFKAPTVTEISENTRSPYQVLVTCLLSLRTKDEVTGNASKRLFKLADTPEKMLKISTKKIEKAIYPVGFYKTKAKRIKEISKILVERYHSKAPDTIEELLKFKGIGRKTANIVLVYGYGKKALPIDTHCHRIPNRLGWIHTKTPEQTELELRKLIPERYWMDFNDLFVQFGQNICKPVKPNCPECPIKKYCNYYKYSF